MREVEIPDGTAAFRDMNELTGGQSDLIEAATVAVASVFGKIPEINLERGADETDKQYQERVNEAANAAFKTVPWTLEESMRLMEWRRAMVFATLDSWTIDRPLPKSMDEVADLPRPLVQALNVAVGGAMMQVGTDFSPDADPESPTIGSSD